MSTRDKPQEAFIQRWSRRRLEAQAKPVEAPTEETVASTPATELPDPETLEHDHEFQRFLLEDVPEIAHQLAMKRLWRSDPTLANLDGLIDYGEDFTDAARARPVLATAYRVGQGMLREAIESPDELAESDNAERQLPSDADDSPNDTATDGKELPDDTSATALSEAAPETANDRQEIEIETTPVPARPKRMQFRPPSA